MGVTACACLPRSVKLPIGKSEEFLRCYAYAFRVPVNISAILCGGHSGRYPVATCSATGNVVTLAGRAFIGISLAGSVKVTGVTAQIAMLKVSDYCSPPRRALPHTERSTRRGEGPNSFKLGCEAHRSAPYAC